MVIPVTLCVTALLTLTALAGCRKVEDEVVPLPSNKPIVVRNEPIEIFTWWNGSGEEEAFQAFMEVFNKQFPSILLTDLSKIVGDGNNAHDDLNHRIAEKRPPDSFQVYASLLAQFLDPGDVHIQNLDALYMLKHWTAKFPKAVVDSLSYNGHIYAVPIGIHRRNTLFCNPALVPAPPVDLPTFFTLAKQLKKNGIDAVTVTVKDADWPLMMLFDSIMAGSVGTPFFKDFYEKKLSFDDPRNTKALAKAVNDFAEVLTYANTDGSELNWRDGAKRLIDKKSAMYIHGDWAAGYFKSQGFEPLTAPSPGTEGLFIFSVDAFSLCTNAPHPENARRFLNAVGSPEGQAAFNRLKGSLPVHSDVSVKGWGKAAEQTYKDFHTAGLTFNIDTYQFIGFPEKLRALYDKKITSKDLINWIVREYGVNLVHAVPNAL